MYDFLKPIEDDLSGLKRQHIVMGFLKRAMCGSSIEVDGADDLIPTD